MKDNADSDKAGGEAYPNVSFGSVFFHNLERRSAVPQAKRTSDHARLFWLNNQPDDAVRRHLIAARWQDWRLYRKYEKDPWQLFNLKSDPREEQDVASEHPEIVEQLAQRHAAWEATLSPLATIADVQSDGPNIPVGHGWAFAKSESSGENE